MDAQPTSSPTRALPARAILSDAVYEATKAMIMDHAIPPGTRIAIDGLARDLGVSPTPVREALARLESEELVVKEPLRGYRATHLLTAEELEDLYDFRRLIEPWAASRAAERLDEAGAARLRAEMESVDEATAADYRLLTAHDTRFHTLIAELSGSRQLLQALVRTHCHLHIFRLHHVRGVGQAPIEEHQRIAEAILRRDRQGAQQAMQAHLTASITQRLRADEA